MTTTARLARVADVRRPLGRAVVLGPTAALVGFSLAVFGQHSVTYALLLALGAAFVFLVVGRGPMWCLGCLVFLAVLGWAPTLVSFGVIDLTPLDVFYVALVVALVPVLLGRAAPPAAPRVDLGQRAIWVFVLFLGIGILGIYRRDPGSAGGSFVSWIRLVQTLTLTAFIPAVVRTRSQLTSLVKLAAVAGSLSVVLAVSNLTRPADVVAGLERAGTFLGPNAVGLVSAFLILLALHSPVPSARWRRGLVVAVGVVGLVASKSIGSFIAIAVVLTIGGFASKARPDVVREQRLLPVVLRTLAVAVAVIDLAIVLRPESVPGQVEFRSSSTMHRVLVGAAGLEIFKQHPIVGVGWQQSSNPEYISDPEVNRALRSRFPDAHPRLFPDVSATSVHNFYIQVLAEAGIVGFALLLWALVVAFARTRRLVRDQVGDPWAYQQARFLGLSLLLVVVWFNENPLFGGQLPTNLVVISLGLALALARMRGEDGQRLGSGSDRADQPVA
ncbi:MAG: O-antigen ligase family protein [Acidimicrobiia bacterium]